VLLFVNYRCAHVPSSHSFNVLPILDWLCDIYAVNDLQQMISSNQFQRQWLNFILEQVIWHDASRSQWKEYVLKGCQLDIRVQIKKADVSRCVCRWRVLCQILANSITNCRTSRVCVTHCQCVGNRRNFAYFSLWQG